jgi:hypothetical protein
VGQHLGVVAAGFFQRVGQDRHRADVTRLVHLARQYEGGAGAPFGRKRNGAERVADDVAEPPDLRGSPVSADFTRPVAVKPKMQAVGACMRKLVMIGYGVLKNRAPFDPQWAGVRPAAGGFSPGGRILAGIPPPGGRIRVWNRS